MRILLEQQSCQGLEIASKLPDGRMRWNHQGDIGKPLDVGDLLYNKPGYPHRSKETWDKIVHHFNVGDRENMRYTARDGKTYCNIYLRDVLRAFCVPIPLLLNGKGTLANMMYDQLLDEEKFWDKPNDEWVSILPGVTTQFANLGIPVVMAIKNTQGHGHVGLVAPNDEGKIILSQAGSQNGFIEFDEDHYSEENGYTEPKFWVNINDYGDE